MKARVRQEEQRDARQRNDDGRRHQQVRIGRVRPWNPASPSVSVFHLSLLM